MSELDNISKKILEMLREDPRIPNNVIAKRAEIAEATVASRLRQMRDNKVMCVALRRNFYSTGNDIQCYVDVSVSGRMVDEVANDLAQISFIKSVAIVLGKPEIVIVISAVDRYDLLRIVTEEISKVEGISAVELSIVLDIKKARLGHANLQAEYNH
ncbi:MAG: Lrp/AsnC family transcriptional regulator [Gammaproteobacteria bacterium]|nr:Lrp/AsnC family transcriptional regulator [Gammaproteobacteria bacterium]